MDDEKRVDPATGEAHTFADIKALYKGKLKKSEVLAYWAEKCKPVVRIGQDGGNTVLANLKSYSSCVLAEYVWLDASHQLRSKSATLTSRPAQVSDLKVWNYNGSGTGQADGHNSEVLLKPRAIFNDPFRGFPHVLVLADAYNAWDDKPAIGNTRAPAAELFEKYEGLDPWFGIEQEYTLMRPGRVGEEAKVPLGFNEDGSEPAPQGPYYTGVGAGVAIGRPVAEEHYLKCIKAGVKIAGINSEVMPGQWEFQVGPCRGIETGDHLTIARYILLRITEAHNVVCSFSPKPVLVGDWSGAGCHTNFSIAPMRQDGGYAVILKICKAFAKVSTEHVAEYGEGNEKRLTGKHQTCSINDFKFGVADRGASIRIPHETARSGKGYMEDRRPGANCDPYRVTARIMKTAGEALADDEVAAGAAKHAAFVFVKPHAVTDKVKDLVKQKLQAAGITIVSEGGIAAERIDKQQLIDTHYGAIAARAVKQKPHQLVVQPKAQEGFKALFGLDWTEALSKGLVFNAVDGAAKLGITTAELGAKVDKLKKDVDLIKFGGGFYCGRVDDIYVINGFYLSMRAKFTTPGSSIYFYEVEWPADKLKWADFRGKVLGPTDPATAPADSLRGLIYSDFEALGLKGKPDTGDNGVHASASPFEALAERCNWLGASIAKDFYGRAMLGAGVPLSTLREWFDDPAVQFEGGKKSLFDLLEDLDAGDCLNKSSLIVAQNV